MPQTRARIEPGTVLFLGPAKTLRIAGPSGKGYVFRFGEKTIVDYADWEWIEATSESQRRFVAMSPPKPPKTVDEPVQETLVTEAVVQEEVLESEVTFEPELRRRRRGNKTRDLPSEDEEQN